MISRSNYEIWFIDFIDGKLNAEDEKTLFRFMDEHPDLKEELDSLVNTALRAPEISFGRKDSLYRKPEEITTSQFDYLCAAHVENDLTPEQEAELEKIIESDKSKSEILGLFRKTKLVAPALSYPAKKSLYRSSAAGQIIRLSLIALSAAAIVALILFNRYIFNPGAGSYTGAVASRYGHSEASSAMLIIRQAEKIFVPGELVKKQQKSPATNSHKEVEETQNETSLNLTAAADPQVQPERIPPYYIDRKELPAYTGIAEPVVFTSLLSPVAADTVNTGFDDRPRLSRFIARTFRETFLNEKKASDMPLKGYEIAEAGVTGLNKLLGWDMTLDKTTDEKGEVKSVYFNSRMIHFNAPVKKSLQAE